MRKIQINVEVNLFERNSPKTINVYADADSPYEAACAAFFEVLQAFQNEGCDLPSFGVKEHHDA